MINHNGKYKKNKCTHTYTHTHTHTQLNHFAVQEKLIQLCKSTTIQGTQTRKEEIKLRPFADDKIIYIDNTNFKQTKT